MAIVQEILDIPEKEQIVKHLESVNPKLTDQCRAFV